MKLNNNKKQAGLTLIEITLVIAVLLGLISVLFIGVSAYKEGSNRAKCILNISSYQKAVRSFQNLYEKEASDTYAVSEVAGTGKLLETFPTCPSGGDYTPADATVTGLSFPSVGTAALTCDKTDHSPNSTDGW
jgi:type II secretory pathway pseudopilin PulG